MQLAIGIILTVVGLLVFFIAVLIFANWTGETSNILWWTLTLSALVAAIGLLLVIAADSRDKRSKIQELEPKGEYGEPNVTYPATTL